MQSITQATLEIMCQYTSLVVDACKHRAGSVCKDAQSTRQICGIHIIITQVDTSRRSNSCNASRSSVSCTSALEPAAASASSPLNPGVPLPTAPRSPLLSATSWLRCRAMALRFGERTPPLAVAAAPATCGSTQHMDGHVEETGVACVHRVMCLTGLAPAVGNQPFQAQCAHKCNCANSTTNKYIEDPLLP